MRNVRSCVFVAVVMFACRNGEASPARGEESSPLAQSVATLTHAAPAQAEPTGGEPGTSWHGIALRRVSGCKKCCGLDFSQSFGATNPDELQLVKEIAAGEGRAEELDCHFAYSIQAFEHLRKLATEKQVRVAAATILQANSQDGIDLGGGELSEVFGVEFMAPVLERYIALKELISPKLEEHVAAMVCSSAYSMVPGKRLNVDRLVRVLEDKGVTSLAERTRRVCAETARERMQ